MLHLDFSLQKNFSGRRQVAVLLLLLTLLMAACVPAEQASPADAAAENAAAQEAAQEAEETADNVITVEPLSLEQAVAPVSLEIPDVDLSVAVEPMGWEVTEADGRRTTKWIVPESAAGWHVNSAGAGGSGNMILSGHQLQGDAVFAPVSMGEVAVGQQVLVEDEEGVVFVYEVTDVSQPIAMNGASEAEQAAALAYVADDGDPVLTLITGWPDFTTTHRVFVQAVLSGVLN